MKQREMNKMPKLRKAGSTLVGKRTFIDFTQDKEMMERSAGVIVLYHGHGFSLSQIAEHTGMHKDTIRHHLRKYRSPLGLRDITINIMSKV